MNSSEPIIQLPKTSHAQRAKKLMEESTSVRRFISFSQRLKTININANQSFSNHTQHILSLQKDENDMTSYTYDVVKHWKSNNKTKHFQIFSREISNLTRTIQEILFNRDKILDMLLHEINTLKLEAAEAVLDIIWTMARELREEFALQYLPKLFVPMISKIDLKESSLMENLFRTLMLLFRFLYPYMINNLFQFFQPYEKLLGHKNMYVRKFSAESFAFLLQKMTKEHYRSLKRKMREQRKFLEEASKSIDSDCMVDVQESHLEYVQSSYTPDNMQVDNMDTSEHGEEITDFIPEKKDILMSFLDILFERLQTKNSDTLYDGVSLLFFHSIKGVLGNFRVGVYYFLNVLLQRYQSLLQCDEQNNPTPASISMFLLLNNLLHQLISYAKSKEVATPVWKALHSHFSHCASFSIESAHFKLAIKHSSVFVNTLLLNPSKIDEQTLSEMLVTLFSKNWIESFDRDTLIQLTNIMEALQLRYGSNVLQYKHTLFKNVPWKNIENVDDPYPLFALIRSSSKLGQKQAFYSSTEEVLCIIGRCLQSSSSDIIDMTLAFTVQYVQMNNLHLPKSFLDNLCNFSKAEFENLYTESNYTNFYRLQACFFLLNSSITSELQVEYASFIKSQFERYYTFLMKNASLFIDTDNHLSISEKNEALPCSIRSKYQSILAELVQTLNQSSIYDYPHQVAEIFLQYGDHSKLIQSVNSYFSSCWRHIGCDAQTFMQDIGLSVDRLCSSTVLNLNLSSFDDCIRQNMLNMLINIGSTHEYELKVLKNMLHCEEQGQSFHNMREKQSYFKKISNISMLEKLSERLLIIVTIWTLGVMWIQLNMTASCTEILNSISEINGDIFWDIVYPHVVNCFKAFQRERNNDSRFVGDSSKDNTHKKESFIATYSNIFVVENILNLSDVFSSEVSSHISATQYFHYLWKDLISKHTLFSAHSSDIISLYELFYNYSFVELTKYKVKVISEKSFIGMYLLDFIQTFVYLSPDDLSPHFNFIYELISTTHTQIQLGVLQILKVLNTPWLTPYMEHIQGVVGSRSANKALEKFSLKSIVPQHRTPLMRFFTKAFLPQLRTQKLMEKKNKKVHEAVIKFLGKVRDESVSMAILEELLSPILFLNDKNSLEVCTFDTATENSVDLKRAISICRFIVNYSFTNSGFAPFMDKLLKIVSLPLLAHMEKYQEKIGSETFILDTDKMETEANNQLSVSTVSVSHDEEETHEGEVEISNLAPECFKLSMLILRKYPDANYSKEILEFHMENALFFFKQWIPVKSSSLPFESKIALHFLSSPTLAGAIFYKDFMDAYLAALKISEFGAAQDMLQPLEKLIENSQECIGRSIFKMFTNQSLHESQTIADIIVIPWVNRIMLSLYELGQKSNDTIILKATAIAKQLSKYFTDDAPADSILFYFGISIPKDATMEDREVVETLEIVKRFVPKASPAVQVKFISYLSDILLNATDNTIRLTVCEIFDNIAIAVPSLSIVARLLRHFEARDSKKISSEDYEHQIVAIREIKHSQYDSFEDLQWIPIVSSLLFKVRNYGVDVSNVCIEALHSIIARVPVSESVDIIEREVRKIIASPQIASNCYHMNILEILAQYSPQYSVVKGQLTTFYTNLASSIYTKKAEGIQEFTASLGTWLKKNPKAVELVENLFFPLLLRLLCTENTKMKVVHEACVCAISSILFMSPKKAYQTMYEKLLSKITASETFSNQYIMNLLVQVTKRFTGNKSNSLSSMATFFIENIVGKLRKCVFAKQGMMNLARIELATLIIEIISTFATPEKKEITINLIIRDLVSKLNSKEKDQRTRSREVLISIIKQLKCEKYLQLAIKNASQVLVDGFQRDVFLVTVQELFAMAMLEENSIPLDSSVDVILTLLFKDVKKDPEHLHTANKIDKKEDHNFGVIYAIVRQLARSINVELSLDKLVIHLRNLMDGVTQRAILQRFENIFDNLAIGLSQNPTVTEEFLVTFSLVKFDDCSLYNKEFLDHSSMFRSKRTTLRKAKYSHLEILPEPMEKGYTAADSRNSIQIQGRNNDVYMVRLLVDVLLRFLKEKTEDISNSKAYSLLFNNLLKYASGDDEKLSLLSLQCLVTMRKRKSPYACSKDESIVEIVLKLLQSCGLDTSSQAWDILYSTLYYYMYKVKFQFDKSFQLNIISILQLEISSQREESMHAYLLVKGMIDAKTMLPQMYDLAKQCRLNLITTNQSEIQNMCVLILKNFLIYYPMEPDLLQEYLNFMFKNSLNTHLSDEAHRGLAEMIHTIVLRFPVEYLQQKIEFLICPLAVQICNEQSPDVKNKLEKSTLSLLNRIDEPTFLKILKLICKWIKSEKFAIVGYKILQIASLMNASHSLSQYIMDPKYKIWNSIEQKLKSVSDSYITIQSMKETESAAFLSILRLIDLYIKKNYLRVNYIYPLWNIFKVLALHPWVLIREYSLKCIQSFLEKYSSHALVRSETEIASLGILALENLLSKNIDQDQYSSLKSFLEMIFAIFMDQHKEIVNHLKPSDESPVNNSFDPSLQNSTLEAFMKKIRTFYIQSQKTEDSEVVKNLRIQCLLEVLLRISVTFKERFAPCLGYFTPTLYLIYEEGRSNNPNIQSQAENCIQALKENIGDEFVSAYTIGRNYIVKIRETRKGSVSTQFLKDQKDFAKQKIAKRKATSQLRKDKRKKSRLESVPI